VFDYALRAVIRELSPFSLVPGRTQYAGETMMAVQGCGEEANPTEDEARRGDNLDEAWQSGEIMAVKKSPKKTRAAKKFKGLRREK
jgi:hypothetical protein